MSTTDALAQLQQLTTLLPALQDALRERAVQQAAANGASITVRPHSFPHPGKGERDPWFGLAYHDWLQMRNGGFRGFYTPNAPDSSRPKIIILYDAAAAWIEARAAAQHNPI